MDDIKQDEQRSIPELIAERNRLAAELWRVSEGVRIVGYSVASLGPLFVLVLWLFDWFTPLAHGNELKEWYFYLGLALILAVFGGLLGRFCSRLKTTLEKRIDTEI